MRFFSFGRKRADTNRPKLSAGQVAVALQRESELLKDGFRRIRKTSEFIKHDSPVFEAWSVQTKRDGSSFCVNLGVHYDFLQDGFEPGVSGQAGCFFKRRLAPTGEVDWWWPRVESSIPDVLHLLDSSGKEFFDRYKDYRNIFAGVTPAIIESSPEAFYNKYRVDQAPACLFLARLNIYLGDIDAARKFLKLGIRQAGRARSLAGTMERVLDEIISADTKQHTSTNTEP